MKAAASVESLCLYPVKAMRGVTVAATEVEPWGFAHDRRWMVVRPDGRFLTQRDLPAMARIGAQATPDGLMLAAEGAPPLRVPRPSASAERREVLIWHDRVPARDAGAEAAAWIGARLGLAAGLVHLDDPRVRPVDQTYAEPEDRAAFSDGFPVLLTTTASLAALNEALPSPVPMARFRPNLVVGGASPWEEDRWQRIRIGTVVFRVAKPCARCTVTTVDQMTGERPDKHEPLRTLGRIRRAPGGVMFGQNLIPNGPGRIALGDPVEILAAGEPALRLLSAKGNEPP